LSFTTQAVSCSAGGLNYPSSARADSCGNLFIADRGNSRVLLFAPNSVTPMRVYGQTSFTTCTTNQGASASATTLNQPTAVAIDSSGNLYALNNSATCALCHHGRC